MVKSTSENASLVLSAANSRKERELLQNISRNLVDTQARKQYLDWLNKRRDQRAIFVRVLNEWIESIDASRDKYYYLLDNQGYSPSWTRILGEELFDKLNRDENWWKARKAILSYARPALSIKPQIVDIDDLPISQSRFGGRASLPASIPWPEHAKGPLSFLGQICLAEIQLTQVASLLPSSGYLHFFALDGNVGARQGEPTTLGDSKVIYTPSRMKLAWRKSPEGVTMNDSPCCRVICEEFLDFPGSKDLIVSAPHQKLLSKHEVDLDDLRGSRESEIHLGGYSRHYRTDDPSTSKEYENLICFPSLSTLDWNWCDGEHLAIFLHQSARAKGDFSKAWGYAS